MMALRREARGADCPSDLGLSQIMTGEIGADSGAMRAHVHSCLRCRRRLASFESQELPPLTALAPSPATSVPAARPRVPSSWRRRLLPIAGLSAAAAAAIVLLVHRGGDPVLTSPDVRVKGELALGVVVRRASGQIDRIASGAAVAPGEALRFELAPTAPGYAAILGLDARKVVSVYVPQDGQPLFLPATGKTVLPGAIALDDAPGAERLFGLVCAEPLPLDQLRRRAADRLSSAGGRPENVRSLDLPCHEATFLIQKSSRR
jgi:hypothetical protein